MFGKRLLKRPYGLVPPTCFISHEQDIIDANSSQRPLSRWELSDCNMGCHWITILLHVQMVL